MTYKPASITGVSTNCCHQQPVQRSGCSWSDLRTFIPGPNTELQQSIAGAPIVDYVLEQPHVPAEIFSCHARKRNDARTPLQQKKKQMASSFPDDSKPALVRITQYMRFGHCATGGCHLPANPGTLYIKQHKFSWDLGRWEVWEGA